MPILVYEVRRFRTGEMHREPLCENMWPAGIAKRRRSRARWTRGSRQTTRRLKLRSRSP